MENKFYDGTRGVGRGGWGAAVPPPKKKKREREEKGREEERKGEKKKRERGIERERKLNQSFQERGHGPLVAPRPPTAMVPAFHASHQPPFLQNPAYTLEWQPCITVVSAWILGTCLCECDVKLLSTIHPSELRLSRWKAVVLGTR